MSAFDVVVIGGGSAGCTAAARLAEDPHRRVLLLEAGGPADDFPSTLVPARQPEAFLDERVLPDRFTVPQPACGGRRVFVGTGEVLGGSSGVNGMVWTRCDARDYDANPPGWRWADLVPAFEAVEAAARPVRAKGDAWSDACVAGAAELGLRPGDPSGGALGDVGGGVVGYEAMTSHPGERRSAFVASLKPALGRPNLVVRTRARVRALRFEGDRAVAVTWDGPRGPEEARVDGEVLLCAGALESPAVLLRSGVGDGDRLRALGIDVVVDLPAVGEGLQDHPNVALFALGTRAIDADKTVLYAFDRVGDALPPGQPDCCLVPYPARASLAEAAARLAPELVLPWSLYRRPWARGAFGGLVGGVFRTWPMRLALARTWGVVAILGKPRSRGSVRLVSADPRVAPAVDPAWLAEPEDVRVMLGAVERAQAWMASAALRPWAGVTLSPRAKGPALERWVRQGVRTTYHFAGTCRLGDVVRDDLRVRGLANVRVGDASILPDVPVAALDAPSRAIGWKAAGLMG